LCCEVSTVFPHLTLVCLAVSLGGFAFGVARQLWLLHARAWSFAWQMDHPWQRLRRVMVDGIGQRRLRNHRWAGLAHQAIFFGFILLLPRTVVLFGRALDASFGGDVPGNAGAAGFGLRLAHHWVNAAIEVLVLLGTGVFAGLRLSRREPRLRPTPSAIWILGVIGLMMLADLGYQASGVVLVREVSSCCPSPAAAEFCSKAVPFVAPFIDGASSGVAGCAVWLFGLLDSILGAFDDESLLVMGVGCQRLHLLLILGFLVVLPYTKHFHLISVWPNLFFDSLAPTGRLLPIAPGSDALLSLVEATDQAGGAAPARPPRVGARDLCDFSAKNRLDWLACTACGRCSDHCPSSATGGSLDPKQLGLVLRGHLQRTPLGTSGAARHLQSPIVPSVVDPKAIWACTSCGGCEEQCPVGVRHVEPIVDMRRDLLMMRGEAPIELRGRFDGLTRQGNPWNLARDERPRWADGLGVRLLKDVPTVEYLYWVGCAASYDGRAGSVAKALVRLMARARISFAILGPEEGCTGDAARRAGNELLFLQLAERNIEILNRYQREGRFQRIIATCPHCLNALRNEYSDLGGHYAAIHHTEAIDQWLADGRLALEHPAEELVTYHDPCTLARTLGITDAPRQILDRLRGVTRIEPRHHARRTFCCGAGGAQIWLSGQKGERINLRRTLELERTGAHRIVSACPFCLSMLDDGARNLGGDHCPDVSDIAELVALRCLGASNEQQ
jgi:Fe-S oxidoreductase